MPPLLPARVSKRGFPLTDTQSHPSCRCARKSILPNCRSFLQLKSAREKNRASHAFFVLPYLYEVVPLRPVLVRQREARLVEGIRDRPVGQRRTTFLQGHSTTPQFLSPSKSDGHSCTQKNIRQRKCHLHVSTKTHRIPRSTPWLGVLACHSSFSRAILLRGDIHQPGSGEPFRAPAAGNLEPLRV